MGIKADPDPGQAYEDTKAFSKGRNQDYLLIFVNFHVPGSGSAYPIWIQIQNRQINVNPCGSGSTTLHYSSYNV
jgi:hypothetical protein